MLDIQLEENEKVLSTLGKNTDTSKKSYFMLTDAHLFVRGNVYQKNGVFFMKKNLSLDVGSNELIGMSKFKVRYLPFLLIAMILMLVLMFEPIYAYCVWGSSDADKFKGAICCIIAAFIESILFLKLINIMKIRTTKMILIPFALGALMHIVAFGTKGLFGVVFFLISYVFLILDSQSNMDVVRVYYNSGDLYFNALDFPLEEIDRFIHCYNVMISSRKTKNSDIPISKEGQITFHNKNSLSETDVNELMKLKELLDTGVITKEEFDKHKSSLL